MITTTILQKGYKIKRIGVNSGINLYIFVQNELHMVYLILNFISLHGFQ